MRKRGLILNKNKFPKILFIDIETSPNMVFVWQCGRKINIGPQQIVKERQIICISYSWEHEKKVRTVKWDLNKQTDKGLLKRFAPIMDKADIIIGHNGDKFDIKWIKGRLLYHGLQPSSLITSIDTLKLARKEFNLNSFSLDYLSKFLGVGKKQVMKFSDWVDIVLHKNKKALKKMITYCEHDVEILKRVFKKMKPYVTLPVNLTMSPYNKDIACGACGSKNYIGNGVRLTKRRVYRRLRCSDCGSCFIGHMLKDNKQFARLK